MTVAAYDTVDELSEEQSASYIIHDGDGKVFEATSVKLADGYYTFTVEDCTGGFSEITVSVIDPVVATVGEESFETIKGRGCEDG